MLQISLSAGDYMVVMDGYYTDRGVYRLAISCPADSFYQGWLTCTGANQTVTGSTTGGTSVVGHAAPEHFFLFSAPYYGDYVFNSCGSSFDTYVIPVC